MVSLEDHTAVVAICKRGSLVSEIPRTLILHREEAHRAIRRLDETGVIENRPRGRPGTTARISALRKAVKDKDQRSRMKHEKIGQVTQCEQFNYAITGRRGHQVIFLQNSRRQRLTDEMKASRLEKCEKMKAFAPGESLRRILFKDKDYLPLTAQNS
ncbi:hypothetical protein V3C99_001184 [Haemonchus contortus]